MTSANIMATIRGVSAPEPAAPALTIPTTIIPSAELAAALGVEAGDVAAMDHENEAVSDMLRAYCGRVFNYVRVAASFNGARAYAIQLPNPPIVAVVDSSDVLAGGYILHADSGVLSLATGARFELDAFDLQIDCGFETIPADLRDVIYRLVQGRIAAGGYMAGASAGAIESITVPDVGTTRFINPSSASAVDAGELAPFAATVAPYRMGAEMGAG